MPLLQILLDASFFSSVRPLVTLIRVLRPPPPKMQTKALLLAAALASPALAASPSPIDARFASSCTSAASSVMGAFSALPEPTGALSTYLDAAASSASDPCSWVAAAPTSLSSEVSSFSSRVSELAVANSAALSQLAACATAIGEGEGAAADGRPHRLRVRVRFQERRAGPDGCCRRRGHGCRGAGGGCWLALRWRGMGWDARDMYIYVMIRGLHKKCCNSRARLIITIRYIHPTGNNCTRFKAALICTGDPCSSRSIPRPRCGSRP